MHSRNRKKDGQKGRQKGLKVEKVKLELTEI